MLYFAAKYAKHYLSPREALFPALTDVKSEEIFAFDAPRVQV
jgi:hypothetical protein